MPRTEERVARPRLENGGGGESEPLPTGPDYGCKEGRNL